MFNRKDSPEKRFKLDPEEELEEEFRDKMQLDSIEEKVSNESLPNPFYTNYPLYKGDLVYRIHSFGFGIHRKIDPKIELKKVKSRTKTTITSHRFIELFTTDVFSPNSFRNPFDHMKEITTIEYAFMDPEVMKGGAKYVEKKYRKIDFTRDACYLLDNESKSSQLSYLNQHREINHKIYFKPAFSVNKILVETLVLTAIQEIEKLLITGINFAIDSYHQASEILGYLDEKYKPKYPYSENYLYRRKKIEISSNLELFRAYLEEAHNYPRFIAERILRALNINFNFDEENVDPVKVLRDFIIRGIHSRYIVRCNSEIARNAMRYVFPTLKTFSLSNFPEYLDIKNYLTTQKILITEYVNLFAKKQDFVNNQIEKCKQDDLKEILNCKRHYAELIIDEIRQREYSPAGYHPEYYLEITRREILRRYPRLNENDLSYSFKDFEYALTRKIVSKRDRAILLGNDFYQQKIKMLIDSLPRFILSIPLQCNRVSCNTVELIRFAVEKGLLTNEVLNYRSEHNIVNDENNSSLVLSMLETPQIEDHLRFLYNKDLVELKQILHKITLVRSNSRTKIQSFLNELGKEEINSLNVSLYTGLTVSPSLTRWDKFGKYYPGKTVDDVRNDYILPIIHILDKKNRFEDTYQYYQMQLIMSTCSLYDFICLLHDGMIQEEKLQYFFFRYYEKLYPNFISILYFIVPLLICHEIIYLYSCSLDGIQMLEKLSFSDLERNLDYVSFCLLKNMLKKKYLNGESEKGNELMKEDKDDEWFTVRFNFLKQKFLIDITYQLVLNLDTVPNFTCETMFRKYRLPSNKINQLYLQGKYDQILELIKYQDNVLPRFDAVIQTYPFENIVKKREVPPKRIGHWTDKKDIEENYQFHFKYNSRWYKLFNYLEDKNWKPTIDNLNYQAMMIGNISCKFFLETTFRNNQRWRLIDLPKNCSTFTYPSVSNFNSSAFDFWMKEMTDPQFEEMINNLEKYGFKFVNRYEEDKWRRAHERYLEQLDNLMTNMENFDERYIPPFATKRIVSLYKIAKLKERTEDLKILLNCQKYWPSEINIVKEYEYAKVNEFNLSLEDGWEYLTTTERIIRRQFRSFSRMRSKEEIFQIEPFPED